MHYHIINIPYYHGILTWVLVEQTVHKPLKLYYILLLLK